MYGVWESNVAHWSFLSHSNDTGDRASQLSESERLVLVE